VDGYTLIDMAWKPRVVVSAEEALGEHADRAPIDGPKIEAAVRNILEAIGDDPDRDGLRQTPRRVAEAYGDLFAGMSVDPETVVTPLEEERARGLIMVRDIPVASVCEHHLLPFIGKAAVAFLPNDQGVITGLSKLPRLVDVLARRPQVQERLVREIAEALERALSPRGVFVLVEAEHMCVSMRGARKPGSITVTTEARGVFADDPAARTELITLARGSSA
jgi:GTP cyclohydrolase IA